MTCEVGKGVVMEGLQVRLALQLGSGAQGGHGAAPQPLCHAAELSAQLQHLLQLANLHLIVGFCPTATSRSLVMEATAALTDGYESVLHR